MGQIIKFPAQVSKLGYKRVKKRRGCAEDRDQLQLFAPPAAEILRCECGLRPFEQALRLEDRGDVKAGELYARAMAEQDCVADAFCNLGIIESQKGNRIKAFNCFTNSLRHDPRHS